MLLLLFMTTVSCDNSEDETGNELEIVIEPVTSIGLIRVSANAKIEDHSNFSIDKVGFCWNTEPTPTISNDTINSSLSSGQFNFSTNTLDPDSHYYLRAFALFEGNIYYSSELEFKTKSLKITNDITYRYDYQYIEEGISAISTSDGGFIIAGNLNRYYNHLRGDIILLKYNSDCEMSWKTVLSDSNTSQYVSEIIQDTSGNFLVVSDLFGNNGREPTLTKFDQSGNLLWEINVDERINDENGIYSAASLIETTDGNYALAGNWNPNENSPLYPDSNFSLIKISKDGEVLFKKNYGAPNHNEHSWTLLENSNKKFILVGTGPGQNRDANMKLIKLDSDGTLIWEKDYGGSKNEFPKSAISTNAGNIVIAGYTNSYSAKYKIWLVKMDWDGNIIWENTVGNENGSIFVNGPNTNALIEDRDNNLLIASSISFAYYRDMYAVKTNNNGELLWDKILNSTANIKSFDGATSFIELADGAIVLVGHKEDEVNPRFDGTTSDIWFVKMIEE